MTTDPFRRPIPLQSLTDETGQWAWNEPPEYANVDDFIDELDNRFKSEEEARIDILDLFTVGVTVEQVVNTIAITGFSKGKITPDAAALAKGPLAVILLDRALDNEVAFQIFNSMPEDKQFEKNVNKLELMSELNPDGFEALKKGLDDQVAEENQEEKNNSFIKMEKEDGNIATI